MSEASVHFAREDYSYHDVANTQSTSPSEVVMVVEANVDLKDFAIDVYSSEFLCLLDDEASALKQMAALIELKDFIWTRDEFRTKILDVLEIKIVPKTVEKDAEEQNENQQSTVEAQQEDNFRKRSRDTLESESDSDEEDEAMSFKRFRSESQEASGESDEHEQQGLRKSPGNEYDASGKQHLIEAGIESDSEEIVKANADVFEDLRRQQKRKNDYLPLVTSDGSKQEHHKDEENTASEQNNVVNCSEADAVAFATDVDDDGGGNVKKLSTNASVGSSESDYDQHSSSAVPELEQPLTTNAAAPPTTLEATPTKIIVLKPGGRKPKLLKKSTSGSLEQNLHRSPRRRQPTAETAGENLAGNDVDNDNDFSIKYKTSNCVLWEPGPLGIQVDRYVDVDDNEVPIVTAVAVDSQAHKAGIQVDDILIGCGRQKYFSFDSFVANSSQRPLHLKLKRKVQAYTGEEDDTLENDEKISNIHLSAREQRFVQKLMELKEFHKQHGHYNVRIQSNPKLYNFISMARRDARLYKENKKPLFKARYEILKELEGFDWGVEGVREKGQFRSKKYDWKKYDWDTCYELLKDYKEKHGHCIVSKQDKENPVLSAWIESLKNHRRYTEKGGNSDILTQERLQKLHMLGFSWDSSIFQVRFEEKLAELKEFYKQHGHFKIPRSMKSLRKFIYDVRHEARLYKANKLPSFKERFEILDEFGFDWGFEERAEKGERRSRHYDWKKYDWDTCYELLKEYKEKHGHSHIPKNSRENPILALWSRRMREDYQAGKGSVLTPERIKKLDDLEFSWYVWSDKWNDNYDRLMSYKEQYGDCLVPKRFPPDPKLGRWVYEMRKAKRHGLTKLTSEREKLLNEVGFVWNVK